MAIRFAIGNMLQLAKNANHSKVIRIHKSKVTRQRVQIFRLSLFFHSKFNYSISGSEITERSMAVTNVCNLQPGERMVISLKSENLTNGPTFRR